MGFRIAFAVKMTGENKAKKDRDPIFTICFVVFVIAAVIAVGYYVHDEISDEEDGTAMYGDTVSVDYTGTLYGEYGSENAVVFDTSYSSVAKNSKIAKSNDFEKRSSYKPLSFQIGKGTVLEDFENAVIGLDVGDEVKIKILAANGYVAANITGSLNKSGNTMASSVTMTYSMFNSLYSDVSVKGNSNVKFTSIYGWDAYATCTDQDTAVIVSYVPTVDEEYTAYESGDVVVKYKVTSFEAGTITYDIAIDGAKEIDDEGHIQMIKLDLGDKVVYINKITDSAYEYKEGKEVSNEDLYFKIKLVSVN